MTDWRAVSTPMAPSTRADVDNDQGATNDASLPYRELMGALMYLAVCTRPDISFAVSYLSQFCQRFRRQHWVAAKRVLRYLKETKDLVYRKTGKPISGYVDADWANCTEDRRSYTGYVFVLGTHLGVTKTAYGGVVIDGSGVHGSDGMHNGGATLEEVP